MGVVHESITCPAGRAGLNGALEEVNGPRRISCFAVAQSFVASDLKIVNPPCPLRVGFAYSIREERARLLEVL